MLLPTVHSPRLRALARTAVMVVLPQGGQGTARRNAWASMSDDAARGRARREADAAVREAARCDAGRQRQTSRGR